MKTLITRQLSRCNIRAKRLLFSHIHHRQATTTAAASNNNLIQLEHQVQQALANGEPVVALESTIIAHGMPYPQNVQVAKEVEDILRKQNVTPATIAMHQGVCRIGLSQDELEDLAIAGPEGRAHKCSTREMSTFLMRSSPSFQRQQHSNSKPLWGATTVASTMKLAHLAGISTFVTGGSGGVHRGGEDTMDVSADLTELARTPVVVVSAGIKSILDIARTLEVLETNGVPVYGWQTDEFPAFFSPTSGVPCPDRVDSPEEVAHAFHLARALELSHGFLVGVPNKDPASGASVEAAIQSALEEAEKRGISGPATTPFVLKSVAETTKGDSLKSNIALVKQNAEVGGMIAKAIAHSTL